MNEEEVDRFKAAERQRQWRARNRGCPAIQRAREEIQQGYAILRELGVPRDEARLTSRARQALCDYCEKPEFRAAVDRLWDEAANDSSSRTG